MRLLLCERSDGIFESFQNSLPDSKPVGYSLTGLLVCAGPVPAFMGLLEAAPNASFAARYGSGFKGGPMRWLLLLGVGECRPGPNDEWSASPGAPATTLFSESAEVAADWRGYAAAAAMLLGARQIVAVGRQRPVGVHNAKHVGMTGVRLVADTGRNGKVVELLASLRFVCGCQKFDRTLRRRALWQTLARCS
jgi:hypothetical protein